MTASHGLLFFGIGIPAAATAYTNVHKEANKVAFNGLRLVYPVALYTVAVYRLLLTLGFGSSMEAALLVPLSCFIFTLPPSLWMYFLLSI
jgi:hypothetical protein